MNIKWIILIVMVIGFNAVGHLFLTDVSWNGTFTIVANVICIGWGCFAGMSGQKEKEK